MDTENGRPQDEGQPPGREISVNQVVAWNMAYFRRLAGITQEQLGEAIGGRPKSAVSADERSWDGKRTREFDAQAIAEIAIALGVPIVALFLPPADDGVNERYLFTAGGEEGNMQDLMRAVVPDTGYESPVMDAYRERFEAALDRYTNPDYAARAGKFLRPATPEELRADEAARIRYDRDRLLEVAAKLDRIAEAVEKPGGAG